MKSTACPDIRIGSSVSYQILFYFKMAEQLTWYTKACLRRLTKPGCLSSILLLYTTKRTPCMLGLNSYYTPITPPALYPASEELSILSPRYELIPTRSTMRSLPTIKQ